MNLLYPNLLFLPYKKKSKNNQTEQQFSLKCKSSDFAKHKPTLYCLAATL